MHEIQNCPIWHFEMCTSDIWSAPRGSSDDRTFFVSSGMWIAFLDAQSEHGTCNTYTVFENYRNKSHLTLRAKWATITFWVAKNGSFWRVFENPKLVVKRCYQTVNYNRTKSGGKCLRISNATFWVISKQCDLNYFYIFSEYACRQFTILIFLPFAFCLVSSFAMETEYTS